MRTQRISTPFRHRGRRRFVVAAVVAAVISIFGVTSSGIAMKANFDSPLNLMNSGQMVDAHGPLSWDAEDASASVTFSITQGSVGGSRTATYSPRDSSWHLTITAAGGGHFHSGSATGSGSAV